MPDWMTVAEAAAYLRVDRKTIYRWCEEGRLPYYGLESGGSGRRFNREDLDGLLVPGGPSEDRTKWRYEQGGAAWDVATRFVGLLLELDVANRLSEVRDLVTEVSWPQWRAAITRGLDPGSLRQLTHVSRTVRYPAEGMAYVIYIVTHPAQRGAFVIDGPRQVPANVVTLLFERDEWRVHQLGAAVAPAQVGRVPFSW